MYGEPTEQEELNSRKLIGITRASWFGEKHVLSSDLNLTVTPTRRARWDLW